MNLTMVHTKQKVSRDECEPGSIYSGFVRGALYLCVLDEFKQNAFIRINDDGGYYYVEHALFGPGAAFELYGKLEVSK